MQSSPFNSNKSLVDYHKSQVMKQNNKMIVEKLDANITNKSFFIFRFFFNFSRSVSTLSFFTITSFFFILFTFLVSWTS